MSGISPDGKGTVGCAHEEPGTQKSPKMEGTFFQTARHLAEIKIHKEPYVAAPPSSQHVTEFLPGLRCAGGCRNDGGADSFPTPSTTVQWDRSKAIAGVTAATFPD